MNTTTSGQEERFSRAVPSPFGPLHIIVTPDTVVGLYHEDHDPSPAPGLLGRSVATGQEHRRAERDVGTDRGATCDDHTEQEHPEDPPDGPVHDDHVLDVPGSVDNLLSRVAVQLEEYFAGSRREFDLPITTAGTAFQRRVWAALADIPHGERRTYGEIASALGNPSMGRAVGAAVRANPLSLIIPGHRVVSRSGAVVGYAAGPAVKEALLDLESGRTPDHDRVDAG